MHRILASITLALGLVAGVTACASSPEPVALDASTVVIDVRTPVEFAAGHLEGALNIDVQSADFDERVMLLDPEGSYFVYCRTGNRSGQAIERMQDLGFGSMVNGGSVENASSVSGIEIVTGQ